MCGFTGFVGQLLNREEVLVNMMNTIIHRGPDSEGKYIDENAALGFRRLSIIDLSKEGDQPLYNEDRSKVLVFNGEIYNYQELRDELVRAGHTFISNTDSETLLHVMNNGVRGFFHVCGGCMHLLFGIFRRRSFLRQEIFSESSRSILHI